MELKLNIDYLAKNDKLSSKIKKGDRICVEKYISDYDKEEIFTIFLPPNEDSKQFFGLDAINRTERFKSLEEVNDFFSGIELEYDLNLYYKRISMYQGKIDKIKKEIIEKGYQIISEENVPKKEKHTKDWFLCFIVNMKK
jgi:hypothetical protein